jgi:hypothetical protein
VRRVVRAGRADWSRLVQWAEEQRGRTWQEMMDDWGDWGRDGTMHVAVRHGRHRMAEVVRAVGHGLKYQAAAQAIRRFQASLPQDAERSRFMERMKRQLRRAEAGGVRSMA